MISWLKLTRKMQRPFLWYFPTLYIVEFQLADDCNLECVMCPYQSKKTSRHMDINLFKNVVDQCAELGAQSIALSKGGEPLMHENFKECLKYVCHVRDHSSLKYVGLVTNGMLFDKSISKLAVSLKLNSVCFSLEGFQEETEAIRKGADYNLIIRNIKTLLSERNNKKYPHIRVNTLNDRNLKFLYEMAELVDDVQVSPLRTKENKIVNPSYFNRPTHSKKYCDQPFISLAVFADGRVTACACDVSEGKLVIGNVKTQSLRDIWRNKKIQQIRNQWCYGISNPLCSSCQLWLKEFNKKTECFCGDLMKISYNRDRKVIANAKS